MSQEDKRFSNWMIGIMYHKQTFFSRWDSVLHFQDNDAVIKNNNWRKKSNDETRVKNPQSCSWLDIWQNQFGIQDPNQIWWNQLIDIFIKASFSRDEQNHFLRLFNIMSFSMFSCRHSKIFLSDCHDKTRSKDDCERSLVYDESETMTDDAWFEKWRNLFTKFGISDQSDEYRWKKRSRNSSWMQHTGGSTSNTLWWEKAF